VDIYFTSSPALADFNNDGKLEIVAYGWNSTESRIYIYNYNAANYAPWPIVVSNSYSECSVTVADLDGDGDLDIVFGDESRLIHAFDISGQEIDGFPVTTGEAVRATPFICDLDQDGHTNLVVSSWDGNVYVWDLNGAYNSDRVPWPTFQANAHRNGQIGFTIPTPTAIGGGGTNDPLPTCPMLVQNYPNPFNPTTTVVFDIPQGAPRKVTLAIYDVMGALVKTLVDEVLPPGRHTREWDARDNRGSQVGTGVYFYRLEEDGYLATKKMLLLQ
jgi:WD40 repeat protein